MIMTQERMIFKGQGQMDDTVAKAKRLGGKVIVEAMDIPNVGRFAVLQDPQHATIAVLQPST